MNLDTVIVGGGLFGQIIAARLRRDGQRVVVMDDERAGSGSKPAACLMKPSWFSSLGREVHQPALRTLDELYGLETIKFKAGPLTQEVQWIEPAKILSPPTVRMQVIEVGSGYVCTARERFEARTVVVAAGVWTGALLTVPGLSPRQGAALLWPSKTLEQPFISVWAPYKQLVAFNRGDGLWVGDGTAVRELDSERMGSIASRCSKAVGLPLIGATRLFGQRPYVPGVRPAYLDKRAPGLWVATGGAKNGTIAAGWCAHKLSEALR